MIEEFNGPALATDCRRDERTVRLALNVLRNFRVLRMDRPGARRAPARWRMNVGGLTWATARWQVANHYATGGPQGLNLTSECGHGART